ncbi:class I SAM-dependent methyltransferase [Lacicoccus alkaliphilus]|uniref:Tellurite resistance protein TehB n=1 Tax=Lacicoccus alkaliphilus DSM 16010 TaxID=1123231 RepID=A0A1M7DR52_9BACL|nr:class I SAM-dependent methyltransferase [Salinicoccus alkaliphilus]SHL81853.1 Tellurite resistance protein TehB [Salinicoccus alkaliphilus DSM 16010]
MANPWDERFKEEGYIYGVEPNEWVRAVFNEEGNLKMALLAEGEGRNAVYLATLGHEITTFDYSREAIEKTKRLAASKGVEVTANLQDLTTWEALPRETYDVSVNVFGHVPKEGKAAMFSNMIDCVRPGGRIIFEFYSKRQLEFMTGGPPNPDMLYAVDEIKNYLGKFPVEIMNLEEVITERHEGRMHQGKSAVIQGDIKKI